MHQAVHERQGGIYFEMQPQPPLVQNAARRTVSQAPPQHPGIQNIQSGGHQRSGSVPVAGAFGGQGGGIQVTSEPASRIPGTVGFLDDDTSHPATPETQPKGHRRVRSRGQADTASRYRELSKASDHHVRNTRQIGREFRSLLIPHQLLREDTVKRLDHSRRKYLKGVSKILPSSLTGPKDEEALEKLKPDPSNGQAASWRHMVPETNSLFDMRDVIEDNSRRSAMGCLTRWVTSRKNRRAMREFMAVDHIPFFRGAIKRIEGYFGSGVVSVFLFARWIFLLNLLIAAIFLAIVVGPHAISEPWHMSDAVMPDAVGGIGLQQSWIFYGGYTNQTSSGWPTDITYLFALFGSMICVLGGIVIRMRRKIKQGFDRAALVRKDRFWPFSSMILSSWDHSVHQIQPAINLQNGVTSNLIEAIADEEIQHDLEEIDTFSEKFFMWARHLTGIFVTLVLLGVTFLVIIYLTSADNIGGDQFPFLAPLFISVLNVATPFLVKQIVWLEDWKDRKVALRTTIFRIYILKMFNLGILVYAINQSFSDSASLKLGQGRRSAASGVCVETAVGQELWRLVLAELVVHSISTPVVGWAMYKWNPERDYDMAQGVIDLIYRQALIWTGTAFCPVLPFVGVISHVWMFWLEYRVAMATATPPTQPWGASRTSNFFTILLCATFVVSFTPTILFLRFSKPVCGPHQGGQPWQTMLDLRDSGPVILRDVWAILSSPLLLIPLVCFLCAILYFARAVIVNKDHLLQESLRERDREHDEKIYIARHDKIV